MRTTRTNSQAAFDVSAVPLMTPELINWLENGMRGQMPAGVYVGENATPLTCRTPLEVEFHRYLEASLREMGPEQVLMLNEMVAESRGQVARPETVTQPLPPYPPIPRFPARPRPPHVALNIEPIRPTPTPTFLHSYQPTVATTQVPAQEPCCSKAKLVPAAAFVAAAGVGVATYYAYKKLF